MQFTIRVRLTSMCSSIINSSSTHNDQAQPRTNRAAAIEQGRWVERLGDVLVLRALRHEHWVTVLGGPDTEALIRELVDEAWRARGDSDAHRRGVRARTPGRRHRRAVRVHRVLEELFPFVNYIAHSRRLHRLCCSENILRERQFSDYETLSIKSLKRRIYEEHQRALYVDDKTVKFTLSFSIGLAFIGLLSAFLIGSVSTTASRIMLVITFGLGIIYILTAGLTALRALRTRPSYGYGTRFLLQIKQSSDATSIVATAQPSRNL